MTSRSVAVRSLAVPALLVVATLLLAGCTPSVPLKPAPDATNPGCAEVVVHLPPTVAELPKRETDAQATGAWGNPASVLLRCGVPVPGPTTLPCLSINGVDWIEDDSDAPNYRFTTYGRTPAIELVIDSKKVSGSTVLVDLADAAARIPAKKKCLGADDVTLPGAP